MSYKNRRASLLKHLKGGAALFPAAAHPVRNGDVRYDFRQESDFYYLTGFDEPECFLLFCPQLKAPFQMFVRPKDKLKELWEGKIHGTQAAVKSFGANLAFSSKDEALLDQAIVDALCASDNFYYRVGVHPELDRRVFHLFQKAQRKLGRTGRPLWPLHDPSELMGEMRVIKASDEIKHLEKAGSISAQAHCEMMQLTKPGMHEYEIEAALFDRFRTAGAKRLGYPSIVASGPNACVLHYNSNERKMAAKDLLLIDAGAEYEYYSGDITRTFPVGGRFTKEQKEIYQAVLNAQTEALKVARPGKSQKEVHETAVEVLTEEMRRLKILKGSTKTLIKNGDFRTFYPHNTGHWLGMDVHDVGRYYNGSYDSPRKLKAGMTFTVEPGLYFSDPKSPAKYKGIGIRIEDDVLITAKGNKVLTSGVPKEIEEVEALCSKK